MRYGQVISGRFVLEERLGLGGTGEVWRATDNRLSRPVAIKVVRTGAFDDELIPAAVDRFVGEVETASAVAHPNVVTLFDVGEHDGSHYLVQELVAGDSLAHELQRRLAAGDGPLPVADAVDVARQICAGLAAAHRLGVLHRDLRLGNVLLSTAGAVKIVDFGIAWAVSTGDPSLAPEQISGGAVDERADFYALGCILFELLTGRPVFPGSGSDLREQHRTGVPDSLRRHRPDVPDPLDAVVEELLQKEPAHRPGTAEILGRRLKHIAQALADAGAGAPAAAAAPAVAPLRTPPSASQMVLPPEVVYGPTVEISAIIPNFAYASKPPAEPEGDLPGEEPAESAEVRRLAQPTRRSLIAAGVTGLAIVGTSTATAIVVGARRKVMPKRTTVPGGILPFGALGRVTEFGAPVTSVAFSQDGRSVFCGGGKGEVMAWDLATDRVVARAAIPGATAGITRTVVLRDGVTVYLRPHTGLPHVWNTETRTLSPLSNLPVLIEDDELDFSPNGMLCAFSRSIHDKGEGGLRLYNIATGVYTRVDAKDKAGLTEFLVLLRFSPDGTKIAGYALSEAACVWTVAAPRQLLRVDNPVSTGGTDLAWSANGGFLAVASTTRENGFVTSWDTVAGVRRARVMGDAAASVALSPDGSLAAFAGADGVVVLEALSGTEVVRYDYPQGEVAVVRFSPDGRLLASAGGDGMVMLWRVPGVS
ncbi:serine/threonine protein kinase [Allocatelliglobosispora scoriae]|uniref:non-specific serine/threonine protein kinase n=1 Tax=Allocatelliglobosispora scoriae TaxID=643052 RepID=A0A841BGP4_9ACTN|nr:serine/threonine-protein kinase [Allocatelliglobosispora scoriae]MBB5866805.1 serine/threonine protein kinase [Allocatelliglobosispora scoriae]